MTVYKIHKVEMQDSSWSTKTHYEASAETNMLWFKFESFFVESGFTLEHMKFDSIDAASDYIYQDIRSAGKPYIEKREVVSTIDG